ncbi:MAG: ABC transporter permease subunit [Pseudomonadota bacterium]
MTAIAEETNGGFRLSQLIYDTRYRSLTIQAVALMAFMLFIGWLVSNAVTNLEALGKDFDFSFLSQPAGYDINQRLIEYDSQSTHGRAAMVGILNTLLVAVLGCITCTIIGVVAGVLRLSNNWLVARIMSIYVEAFRNVPVLIWILIVMAVFIDTMPPPRAFRGDEPDATMLFGAIAVTNRGVYVPSLVWGPGSGVVLVALAASIVGMFLFARYAKKKQEATGETMPVFWINLAILFVPAFLVYLIAGRPIGMEYPALQGFNFQGGVHLRNSLIALWIALSLYTGAFVAENVRAGILSVSKGQSEASAALGLQPSTTMRLVILPQALRVIVPPMISNYLNLTKNSSLAIAVGYMDATGTLAGITLNQTGREMESILLLMAFYLTASLTISAFGNWYNASVKLKER